MMTDSASLDHRENNFDFVRVFAAMSVLFSHQFALQRLPEPLVLRYQTLGGFGVLIFFSISGYLIAQSWMRDPNLWRFAARRLLRIWPGLACTTLLCGLLLGPLVTTDPLKDYFSSDTFRTYFNTLLFYVQPFLSGVFPSSPVAYIPNGVLWTIPIEVRCYGYLAVLGLFGGLRLRWLMLVLLAGLAVFYYGYLDAEGMFDAGKRRLYEIEYATFFFSGVLMYLFADAWSTPRRKITVGATLMSLGALAALTGNELVAAFLITPYMFVVLGTASFPVLRRFGRFGDLSYGIYIYAFPVQQTIIWLLGDKYGFWFNLSLAIAITLLLAYASWHLIEKRALRLKPTRVKAPPSALPSNAAVLNESGS